MNQITIAHAFVLANLLGTGDAVAGDNKVVKTIDDCISVAEIENKIPAFVYGIWVAELEAVDESLLCPPSTICAPRHRGEDVFGRDYLEVFQLGNIVVSLRWRCPIEFGVLGLCNDIDLELFCMEGTKLLGINVDGHGGGSRSGILEEVNLIRFSNAMISALLPSAADNNTYIRVAPSPGRIAELERVWRRDYASWKLFKMTKPEGILTIDRCRNNPRNVTIEDGYWIDMQMAGEQGLHRLIPLGRFVLDVTYFESANLGRSRDLEVYCVQGSEIKTVTEIFASGVSGDEGCPFVGGIQNTYKLNRDGDFERMNYRWLRQLVDCSIDPDDRTVEWYDSNRYHGMHLWRVNLDELHYADDDECRDDVIDKCDRICALRDWLNDNVGWFF